MSDRPRITCDVSPELYARWKKVVLWGLNKEILMLIISEFTTTIEQHGTPALSAFITGALKLKDVSPTTREASGGDNER